MLVIGVRHKPMKMAKEVDGNDYRRNFKGGVPPLIGVRRGRSPLAAHALWWVPEGFPLL